MRGLSKEKIPIFAEIDARTAKKEGRFIFILDQDNNVRVIESKNWRMDTISILGPTWEFEKEWEEVLLAEIGIGKVKAYHPVKRSPKRKGESQEIPKRKKFFTLSPRQYQAVAPLVFEKIEVVNYQKVSSWKKSPLSGNSFMIWLNKGYFSRKYNELSYYNPCVPALVGTRFCVSLKDEFFIRDVYWAELNLNKILKNSLDRFAKFIDIRLTRYRKGFRNFKELKGVQDIKEITYNWPLPPYLLLKALDSLPGGQKNKFYIHLVDLINQGDNITKEHRLSSLAISNPNLDSPKTRLNNIQLRVTTGLNAKKDYIVFEVYPQKK